MSQCIRCGGLTTEELLYEEAETDRSHVVEGQKCFNCGDVVDELILANREMLVDTHAVTGGHEMKIMMVIPHTLTARTSFGADATSPLYRVFSDSCAAYVRAYDSGDLAAMVSAYNVFLRAAYDYNKAVKEADAEEDARKGEEVGPCPHGCYECGKVCESTDMVWCSCLIDYRGTPICLGCIRAHIIKRPLSRGHGFTTHSNFRCQVSALAESIIGEGGPLKGNDRHERALAVARTNVKEAKRILKNLLQDQRLDARRRLDEFTSDWTVMP